MNVDDWLQLAKRRADQLDEWEATKIAELRAPYITKTRDLLAQLAKRYVTSIGSIYMRDPDSKKIDEISTWLDDELAAFDFAGVSAQITELTQHPYTHGMVTASLMLGTTLAVTQRHAKITDDARETAQWATDNASARISQARELTGQAKSWGGFTAAIAKTNQVATAISIGASAAIVRAAANGIKARADATNNVTIMWICQPNACLLCEPYDGVIMGEGSSFATADGQAQSDGPPIHANCQCRLGVASEDVSSIVNALQDGAYQELD